MNCNLVSQQNKKQQTHQCQGKKQCFAKRWIYKSLADMISGWHLVRRQLYILNPNWSIPFATTSYRRFDWTIDATYLIQGWNKNHWEIHAKYIISSIGWNNNFWKNTLRYVKYFVSIRSKQLRLFKNFRHIYFETINLFIAFFFFVHFLSATCWCFLLNLWWFHLGDPQLHIYIGLFLAWRGVCFQSFVN